MTQANKTEVITLNYYGSAYFEKYPGGFIFAHLSDWTADKKQAPIGKGIIYWKEFFAAAKTGGVKNFFVEMDMDTYKDKRGLYSWVVEIGVGKSRSAKTITLQM